MRRNSTYEILGLPDKVQHTIFVISLLLFLAPYFAGVDLGVVKIPKLGMADPDMKIIGPVILTMALLAFAKLWPTPPETPTVVSRALAYATDEKLRFGLSLGWQLGRFEIVDGSHFAEAQQEAPSIRAEIAAMLSSDGFPGHVNSLGARDLIQSILLHYATEDVQKHAAVLVGIAAMRTRLIDACSSDSKKKEMSELALSAINEADQAVIRKKSCFFKLLLKASPKTIVDLVTLVKTTCR